jgi:trigger factor
LSQPETITLDHQTVHVTRKPGCIVHLDINVDPVAAKAAYTKATKAVSKEVSIPGFRKGKAPESVIIQQFGKHVQREWQDLILNTAFKEFLGKTGLYPFSTDHSSIRRAEVKNASLENGAQVVIEYEAKPVIPPIDPASMVLKAVEREKITAEQVDQTLHQIQLHHAEWHLVTDRPVQDGDFVDLSIEALEEPPRSICKEMRFEVAQGKMGEWMRKLVLGRHVNDVVEGMSEREADLDAAVEFKPTLCRITLHKIRTAALPSLDDALAAKVGVSTLEELRPRIEEDLNRRADGAVKDQMRAQVEEILLSRYPFEVPSSLIEKQRKEVLEARVRRMSQQEVPPEQMAAALQSATSEISGELDRAYRLFFIARKVAEEQGIEVYENEVMQEMMRQLMLPPDQALIDHSTNPEEARSKLYVNVLSQKVLDYLASKATIQ